MNGLREKLQEELRDEEYRYAYDEEFANSRMATQIKVIREQQKLTQAELAEQSGMKQSRISALENVNYAGWSVSTLRRLARALGVRFAFKFESWGELLPEIEAFSRQSLERVKFDNDPVFQEAEKKIEKTLQVSSFEEDQFKEKAAHHVPPQSLLPVISGTAPKELKAAYKQYFSSSEYGKSEMPYQHNQSLPREENIFASGTATLGFSAVTNELQPRDAKNKILEVQRKIGTSSPSDETPLHSLKAA